jgi:glycosyltransferase involved in cell wall biosynthesis
VIFANNYFPNLIGGAEKAAQMLAEGLPEKGFTPIVVALSQENAMRQMNGVRIYSVGIKNLYLPFGSSLQKPSSLRKFLWHALDCVNPLMAQQVGEILNRERPDLVNTHNLAGFSVSVWKEVKARGLPLVHTLQDYYLLCLNASLFQGGKNCDNLCWHCRPFAFPKRRLSSLVDGVVGVSDFILRRHVAEGYFPRARKRVIDNPAPRETSKGTSSQKFPIRFGYLGRLAPHKGVELLLNAFSQFPPAQATLSLAGTGESDYVKKLQRRYESSVITFLGFTPNEKFFHGIDVLIVPSLWHDPKPLVVLEALAWGKPVLAARRGGIPEVVEEGKTGFLFDPASPGDLTSLIHKFLREPSLIREMAHHCWELWEKFDPREICQQYASLFQSFL